MVVVLLVLAVALVALLLVLVALWLLVVERPLACLQLVPGQAEAGLLLAATAHCTAIGMQREPMWLSLLPLVEEELQSQQQQMGRELQ